MTTPTSSSTANPGAEEILRYLGTIRDSIANDLRPELQTDSARRSADALVLVLARLGEKLGNGDATAVAQASAWDEIARALPSAAADNATSTAASPSPRDQLERRLQNLQQSIQTNPATAGHLDVRTPAGVKLLKQVSDATSALWEAVEENVHGAQIRNVENSKSPATDVEALRARLGAYLQQRFPELPENPVTSLKLYYGGYGKQMAKLTLVDNKVLPHTLVLRRDLAFSNTATRSADEFPVLQRAYALGLPLPKPILAEADAGILDGTFLLMEEVADAQVSGATFAKDRAQQPRLYGPDYGRDMARTLATLHSKTEVAQRSAAEREQARDALLDNIRTLRNDWLAMDRPPLSVGVDLGFALLLDNPLSADRPHCLVHADCGMHNCLVRDGKLVALLDWELTHEGDPAEDLAIMRMLTAGDVIAWPDFVREYIAAGGNPASCDPWAVAYHSVLLLIRHSMMASNVRAIYHKEVRNDAVAASVATHIVDRLLQYQARALKIASDTLAGAA